MKFLKPLLMGFMALSFVEAAVALQQDEKGLDPTTFDTSLSLIHI